MKNITEGPAAPEGSRLKLRDWICLRCLYNCRCRHRRTAQKLHETARSYCAGTMQEDTTR